MKRSLILIIIGMICFDCNLFSQTQTNQLMDFYYANGTQQYWQDDHTSANIIVRNTNNYDSIVSRLEKIFNGVDDDVIADDEDNNIFVNSQSLALRNISELISSISLSNNDIAFFTYAKQVNGNQDELHLQFSPDVTPTQIELHDLQGRLVRSQRNGLESLNLQGLSSGTYTMRVTLAGGKVFTDKVVKN